MRGTHEHHVRVYSEDVDFLGIVYHANYICYFERARTELLRQHNLMLGELKKLDVLFVIHELNIKYTQPAQLDDLLTITTILSELKTCSFVFDQFMKNQDGTPICEAKVHVVCVNSRLKPKRLPEFFKQ